MQTGICIYCRQQIYFGVVIEGEWSHPSGSSYCLDENGFTATPIHKAKPALETEVL